MISLQRESNESKALGWLRFPLAALVVLVHSGFTDNKSDFAYYLGTIVSSNLASIAVPTFFFISGYLFFAKYENFGRTEYVVMLKKKVMTLFVPYLIWNFIAYYVYGLFNHFVGNIRPWELYRIFWAQDDGYVVTSLLGYKFSILCAPFLGPLWFVRDLMVVMLLSPIIWWIIRRCKMWSLVVFLIPWLLYLAIPIKGFGLLSLCSFPLGATFSICGKNIFKDVHKYEVLVITLFLVLWAICSVGSLKNMNLPRLLNQTMLLFGLMSALAISYRFGVSNNSQNIIRLGECSFFVYVFHTLFVFNPIMSLFINPLTAIPTVGYTLAYITTFIVRLTVSVGIYYAMKRVCPKLLACVVGGRIEK